MTRRLVSVFEAFAPRDVDGVRPDGAPIGDTPVGDIGRRETIKEPLSWGARAPSSYLSHSSFILPRRVWAPELIRRFQILRKIYF